MYVCNVYVKFGEHSEWQQFDVLDTKTLVVFNHYHGREEDHNYVADAYDVRFIEPKEITMKARDEFLHECFKYRCAQDTVMLNVAVTYTTYDSSRAWCNDGYDVLIEGIEVDNPAHYKLVIDAVKNYFTEDGFNYSNPDRVEDIDGYAYGYTVTYSCFNAEQVAKRIASIKEEQIKLQEELERISALV